ncbi:hypothetical protein, partial [Escherichia coli]
HRPRCRRVPARALVLSRRARYPLHAGNENRNGAQGKRRYP